MAEFEPKKKSQKLSEIKEAKINARLEAEVARFKVTLEADFRSEWSDPEFQELVGYIKNQAKEADRVGNKLIAQFLIFLGVFLEAIVIGGNSELKQMPLVVIPVILVALTNATRMIRSQESEQVKKEKEAILDELSSRFGLYTKERLAQWQIVYDWLPELITKIEREKTDEINQRLIEIQDRLIIGEDGELVDPFEEDLNDFSQQTSF